MAIPTIFVYGVMKDRLSRFETVRGDISHYQGGQQSVLGPVLLVPYTKQVQTTGNDNKVQITTVRGEAVVFAETGMVNAQLTGKNLYRGIYSVPVFQGPIAFDAHFDLAQSAVALKDLDSAANYDWSNVRLVMGVSNTIGILQEIALTLPGGAQRRLKPMAGDNTPSDSTSYAPVSGGSGYNLVAAPVGDLLKTGAAFDVKAALELSGAERFSIASFAKDTKASVTGKWIEGVKLNPSFEGGFLPTDRKVTPGGFTATWSAPLARRGIPEVGADSSILARTSQQDFALRMVEQTNVYTGVDRALKYAMMFIGLVFLAYFMFEIVSGLRAHPAQYIMVGLAQAIFYLLLLAFAERIGFDLAFLIAAAATVTMISLYVGVVFHQMRYTIAAFLVFIVVYALMYVLMQAEDYALIVGAVTSFAALAALMYLTRKVAWYGATDAAETPAARAPT